MNKADQLIERGATRLRALSDQMAARGGLQAKLAEELAEDAAFLRKLKPSLIKARAKGEAPTNEKPGQAQTAPRAPQISTPPKPPGSKGPNPFLVVGAALVAGIVVAKVIDWRGHAHPRK
jgi:hypothetical protein